MTGAVSFGARNLNDLTNYVVHPRGIKLPDISTLLQHLPLATLEGSDLSLVRYPELISEINGWIHADTEQAAQDARDAMILDLSRDEQNLRLGHLDNRYWRARLQDIKFEVINPLGYDYHATFAVLRPFAYANSANANVVDNNALTLVAGNHYRKVISVPVGGTIHNWPTITLTFAGGPFGTTEVWVYNASTGQQTMIDDTGFSANDVIEMNSDLEIVTVEGVPWHFQGQFIYLDPRAGVSNSIEIHTTSTSVPTINATIASRNRYR